MRTTRNGDKKINKRKGAVTGKRQSIQQHSNIKPSPLDPGRFAPSWKDIPLSNYNPLEWIDYLEIPNFKGIFFKKK